MSEDGKTNESSVTMTTATTATTTATGTVTTTGSNTNIVKSEPMDIDQEPISQVATTTDTTSATAATTTTTTATAPVSSSSANVIPTTSTTTSSSNEEEEEEEEDPIVREIDVYISPNLAHSLHLIQYPLHPVSSSVPPIFLGKHTKGMMKETNKNKVMAARIRPQHSMLELDVDISNANFSTNRQIPEALNLQQRTLAAHPIAAVTHMALGVLSTNNDDNGTKLDLIPLTKPTYQMRPSMDHVDRAVFQDEDDELENTIAETKEQDDGTLKPISFQKKDSERAILAKRSSYAYLKASRESEEWIDLQVYPHTSSAYNKTPAQLEQTAIRNKTLTQIPCSRREVDLQLYKTKSTSTTTANKHHDIHHCTTDYVKSLNYLPQVFDMTSTSTDDLPPATITTSTTDDKSAIATLDDDEDNGGGDDEDVQMVQELPTWKRDLVSRMTHIFQSSGAVPLPYNVVRSRVPAVITDEHLLDALSANAALVRGNFVLKSSLLYNSSTSSSSDMISSDASKNNSKARGTTNSSNNNKLTPAEYSYLLMTVRDVLLILFQTYGWVQRHLILQTFEEDYYGSHLTEEMLDSIFHALARKTINGMEMRLDDDLSIQLLFPQTVASHQEYWERKTQQYQHYLQTYKSLLEKENNIQQTTD